MLCARVAVRFEKRDQVADELDWLPGAKGSGINIAYEAVDRHVKNGFGVVADDLVAGVYANLVVRMLT